MLNDIHGLKIFYDVKPIHRLKHEVCHYFRLRNNLYYTNGIEWSASAMEMSAIAAKNVANMVYYDWRGGGFNNKAKKETRPNKETVDTMDKQERADL